MSQTKQSELEPLAAVTAYFDSTIHHTAIVEMGATIGPRSRVWHHCHVRALAVIGTGASIGKNCYVEGVVGDYTKVQNNVSIYLGVILESHTFVGPSVVFTNDRTPRADAEHWTVEPTLIEHHASIGANATIRCGIRIGAYAMVAAGAVVSHDVPPHACVRGNPARLAGWVCRRGHRMTSRGWGSADCPECQESVHVGIVHLDRAGGRSEFGDRVSLDAGRAGETRP